jgi:hypothetical protein
MKKNILLSLFAFLVITACNNSSDDAAAKDDTTNQASHDTSHNMTTTGAVPELPAVPEGAKVYFKSLKNDAAVSSPVKVEMGADNIRIDTAGPVVAASGHFHIFIDAEDSLSTGTVVPTDSAHRHYGKAQVVDNLTLSPGKHKLTIQFADGLHRSYGSKLATTVTVNVKK